MTTNKQGIITNKGIQNISKKYPIGIATLKEIITNNYVYVDKTHFAYKLISSGKYYFLSRPRRFGKSLFLDTLKQVFLSNYSIFKGLNLEEFLSQIPKSPVIHIVFGASATSLGDFKVWLHDLVNRLVIEHKITLVSKNLNAQFQELIQRIEQKYNSQVVLLIDEYDKPILDNIDNPERDEIAKELQAFYSVIKDCDPYLKFVFITGVTRFSKMNLFSGLNNLRDISMAAEFADICGYTEKELDLNFQDELSILTAPVKENIKSYYNGYNFGGNSNQQVYSPQDILEFFADNNTGTTGFKNYWVRTGNPSYLIRLLKKKEQPLFLPDNIQISDIRLNGTFDIDAVPIEVLLFQAGYLTIKSTSYDDQEIMHTLNFPNKSVEATFKSMLSAIYLGAEDSPIRLKLKDGLITLNFEKVKEALNDQLAAHSYLALQKKTSEFSYSNIFHALFNNLGSGILDCQQERETSVGRMDLILILRTKMIIIFELKLDKTGQDAIQQIHERSYYKSLVNSYPHYTIHLVGMNIDRKKRMIDSYKYEQVKRN